MTNAEEGIYFRLLIHSWNYPDCILPDDISSIRKLAKNAPEKQVRSVLEKCFTRLENGWRNEKIFEIFLHTLDKSEKASNASKCRNNKNTHKASDHRTMELNANETGAIINHESLIIKESKDMGRKKPAPDPRVKEVMDYFFDTCQIRRGFKPTINGKKDGASIQLALKGGMTVDHIKECINFFLMNEKADSIGISLSVALSAHTQNLFKQNKVSEQDKGAPLSGQLVELRKVYPSQRWNEHDAVCAWKSVNPTDEDAKRILAWVSRAKTTYWKAPDAAIPGVGKFLSSKQWTAPMPESKLV